MYRAAFEVSHALDFSEAYTGVCPAQNPQMVPEGGGGREPRTPCLREGQQATINPTNCTDFSHIPFFTLGIIPEGHTHNPIKQP